MTQDEFNHHYKILYGDMIMKDLDINELREMSSCAMSYINLTCKYDDYLKFKKGLKKHLADQDIRVSMFEEREE